MKEGGIGGANTLTGLNFENKVDFQNLLGKINRHYWKPKNSYFEYVA
jgi:hypothetical protein